jgi:hypothetical protein
VSHDREAEGSLVHDQLLRGGRQLEHRDRLEPARFRRGCVEEGEEMHARDLELDDVDGVVERMEKVGPARLGDLHIPSLVGCAPDDEAQLKLTDQLGEVRVPSDGREEVGESEDPVHVGGVVQRGAGREEPGLADSRTSLEVADALDELEDVQEKLKWELLRLWSGRSSRSQIT